MIFFIGFLHSFIFFLILMCVSKVFVEIVPHFVNANEREREKKMNNLVTIITIFNFLESLM